MDDFEFVIAVVAITCGTFLITVKMIIGAIKWRIKQKGGQQQGDSLALAELEEIVREASLEANQPLAARLRRVEQHMRVLSEENIAPGMRSLSSEEDMEPEKTMGRGTRERT
jgi:hypothetical protein